VSAGVTHSTAVMMFALKVLCFQPLHVLDIAFDTQSVTEVEGAEVYGVER
jgi:hypothetical protein